MNHQALFSVINKVCDKYAFLFSNITVDHNAGRILNGKLNEPNYKRAIVGVPTSRFEHAASFIDSPMISLIGGKRHLIFKDYTLQEQTEDFFVGEDQLKEKTFTFVYKKYTLRALK